jgi:acetylornithine deacetylase
MANLDFFQMYREIIAQPSISSSDIAWDQSNEQVIIYWRDGSLN